MSTEYFDQLNGFIFYMFLGGSGFGLIFGLIRFLIFTWVERYE